MKIYSMDCGDGAKSFAEGVLSLLICLCLEVG